MRELTGDPYWDNLCNCEQVRLRDDEKSRDVTYPELEELDMKETHTRAFCLVSSNKPFMRIEYGQ